MKSDKRGSLLYKTIFKLLKTHLDDYHAFPVYNKIVTTPQIISVPDEIFRSYDLVKETLPKIICMIKVIHLKTMREWDKNHSELVILWFQDEFVMPIVEDKDRWRHGGKSCLLPKKNYRVRFFKYSFTSTWPLLIMLHLSYFSSMKFLSNMFDIGKSKMTSPAIIEQIIKNRLNVLGGVQILNSMR